MDVVPSPLPAPGEVRALSTDHPRLGPLRNLARAERFPVTQVRRMGHYLPQAQHRPGEPARLQPQACLLLQLPQACLQQLRSRDSEVRAGPAQPACVLRSAAPGALESSLVPRCTVTAPPSRRTQELHKPLHATLAPHFTDRETEAPRGEVTRPRPRSSYVAESDQEPRSSDAVPGSKQRLPQFPFENPRENYTTLSFIPFPSLPHVGTETPTHLLLPPHHSPIQTNPTGIRTACQGSTCSSGSMCPPARGENRER